MFKDLFPSEGKGQNDECDVYLSLFLCYLPQLRLPNSLFIPFLPLSLLLLTVVHVHHPVSPFCCLLTGLHFPVALSLTTASAHSSLSFSYFQLLFVHFYYFSTLPWTPFQLCLFLFSSPVFSHSIILFPFPPPFSPSFCMI